LDFRDVKSTAAYAVRAGYSTSAAAGPAAPVSALPGDDGKKRTAVCPGTGPAADSRSDRLSGMGSAGNDSDRLQKRPDFRSADANGSLPSAAAAVCPLPERDGVAACLKRLSLFF